MQWMREARSAKGLTFQQLSEATGIDRHTLSRYENGRQEPSITRGLLVARALGVSLDLVAQNEGATGLCACGKGESAKTNGGRTAAVEGSATPAHQGA